MQTKVVLKRDKSKEAFDLEKIKNAVIKAFDACHKQAPDEVLREISALELPDEISVEEIQNRVEDCLMDVDHEVARAFILYREQHKQSRLVRQRLDYMEKYSASTDNAATSSETDANANVTFKNVANLEGEVYKTTNRIIHRQRMKEELHKLFPEVAHQYERDLESHIIYCHDESQTPALKAYTYSSKEVVEVLYNGKSLLLPLDLLYSVVDEPEELVDAENLVYQKHPWYMYIKDINNTYTKVTALTRKKRHRPLVRVKTAFGEDLVVTDNHPMITDKDNIESTIQAKDSLNSSQYRIGTSIKFKGTSVIDMLSILPTWVEGTDTFIKYQQSVLRRYIEVSRDLGYIVGFFVGDGGYNNTNKSISITQKERPILDEINNKLYSIFGIAGTIDHSGGSNREKYNLNIHNQYVYELFRGYFKIQDKAQNKTLPYNILEFNEEFAKGCLEGLIDSDGTIEQDDCKISIRLSSRACVLQGTYLFRYFGYSVGNTVQSLPFSNNTSYHTNYTIWGITATKREDSVELSGSFKVRAKLINAKSSSLKYKSEGYCNITNVQEIEPASAFYSLNEFIYDITTETHTFASNNILVHNCMAATLYPLMTEGTGNIDGVTPSAPNDIQSFSGQVTNLMFLLSSQVRGAVAMGDYIVALNYYVIQEFGTDWYQKLDTVVSQNMSKRRTVKDAVRKGMKQFIYGINQPAGNRSYNSPFSNLNFFDKYYYKALFDEFYYPDGTKPEWKAIDTLQRIFMELLRELRLIKPLTFPVTSVCMLHDNEKCLDEECRQWVADEWAKGSSFFLYLSNNPNSVSSCCRVQNEITENTFSSTIGLTGIMTGSANVITLNLNRIVQDYCHKDKTKFDQGFDDYFRAILDRVYKYQIAYKTMLYDMEDRKMFSCSNAGYIFMKKLYCTIGVIGYCEAAEFLGLEISNNEKYKEFLKHLFQIIQQENTKHSIHDAKRPFVFNLEAIPGENLAVKLYEWDKTDGYYVPADQNLYSSYFFKQWDNQISLLDKIKLHGRDINTYCGGGQACHLHLDAHLSKEQYLKLIDIGVKEGCNYFTFNIPISECKDCGHVVNAPITECPICHSKNIDYWVRIIGFLRPMSTWSAARQIEGKHRVFMHENDKL